MQKFLFLVVGGVGAVKYFLQYIAVSPSYKFPCPLSICYKKATENLKKKGKKKEKRY